MKVGVSVRVKISVWLWSVLGLVLSLVIRVNDMFRLALRLQLRGGGVDEGVELLREQRGRQQRRIGEIPLDADLRLVGVVGLEQGVAGRGRGLAQRRHVREKAPR